MPHPESNDGERAVRTAFPPPTMNPDEPLAKSDGASKARRWGRGSRRNRHGIEIATETALLAHLSRR